MNGLIVLLLTGFLGSLSVIWISLFEVAGLQVNLAHLCFTGLALIFGLWRFPEFWRDPGGKSTLAFSACYALYLTALFFSLFMGNQQASSYSLLVKYAAYFTIFFIVVVILGCPTVSNPSIGKAVYWGSPLGIAVFLGFATYVFFRAGRNFALEFGTALVQGDLAFLQFRLFLPLLNYNASEIDRTSDTFIAISRINTLTGTFVLYLQLVWIYRRAASIAMPPRLVSIICWSVTLFSLGVILGSASRTNIAAVILSALAALTAHTLSARDNRQFNNIVILLFIGACLLVFGVVVLPTTIGVDDMLAARFSGETLSGDSRLAQYSEAWERIRERPFTGYGLGAGIDLIGDGGRVGQQVHNLFLASWYEAGIAGLCGAIAFYGCCLAVWFRAFFQIRFGPERYFRRGISPYWAVALPCLPLVRAMFSGQGGNFTLVEWVCLAFFFAINVRNEQLISKELLVSERDQSMLHGFVVSEP
jgi:O-antigen ligase